MPDPWAFGWDQIAAFLNVAVIGVASWVAGGAFGIGEKKGWTRDRARWLSAL